MLDANFWQNKSTAQKVVKEKKLHEDLISSHSSSVKELKELNDLYELAVDENNQSIINETLKNIENLKFKYKKKDIIDKKRIIEVLKKIKFLLKNQGMTIKGAKKALETSDSFNLDDSLNKSINLGKKSLVLRKKVTRISKLIKDIKDLK